MDLDGIMLSEISQKQKVPYDITNKMNSLTQRTDWWLPEGKVVGMGKSGDGSQLHSDG